MNLDKFLTSQTFKTGIFVLLVLFVFVIVFKMGVVFGYKKAHFSYKYGTDYHKVIGTKFWGHQKSVFGKEHLIKIKALLDSASEGESAAGDVAEEE